MTKLYGKKPDLLLKPNDFKPTNKAMRIRGVLNPTALRLKNGKILLVARIAETPIHGEKYFMVPRMEGTSLKPEMKIEKISRSHGKIGKQGFVTNFGMWRLPTISHFRYILLDKTGAKIETISQKPDFCGYHGEGDFGVEDPRITFFEKEQRYAMTYVSISINSGVSTSLALSKNLRNWKRQGIIFRQQNKDVVLFPEKINGYYVALHRPEGVMVFDKSNIWVSYSKDLVYWGRDKPLLFPRKKGWDSLKIGAGTVPLKTKEGFLEIYHGVKLKNMSDPDSQKVYRAGAVLFDRRNPEKILARTRPETPLFEPKEKYEKEGFMNNVIFPTGAVQDLDGKSLLVYSGCADSCVSVRKITLKEIMDSMEFL